MPSRSSAREAIRARRLDGNVYAEVAVLGTVWLSLSNCPRKWPLMRSSTSPLMGRGQREMTYPVRLRATRLRCLGARGRIVNWRLQHLRALAALPILAPAVRAFCPGKLFFGTPRFPLQTEQTCRATRGGSAMPNPPVPFPLKVLRGNPGKRPMKPSRSPRCRRCPEPPPFITGYAADEWWRTAPELHRLGLLTRIDVPALAAYCHAFGEWRMAVKRWRRCRRTIRS